MANAVSPFREKLRELFKEQAPRMVGGDVVLAFKLSGRRDLGVGARFHS
jgi:hypothetical protein